MPGKVTGWKTKYNGVAGVGTLSVDESIHEKTRQGTYYAGLYVTESVKNDLLNSELGPLLRVHKTPGEKYRLMPKYPENGYDGKNSFRIRKNMNYITKGLAKLLVDKNGNVNFRESANEIQKMVTAFYGSMEWKPNLVNACRVLADYDNMSKEDKADFDRFIGSPDTFQACRALMIHSEDHFRHLGSMALVMEMDNLDAEHQRAVRESLADFENGLMAIQRAASMNVEKEQDILNYNNCEGMAVTFNSFCMLAQNEKCFREGKPLPQWESGINVFNLKNKVNKNRFAKHVVFGRTVKIDNKDVYVTLENTAPPSEKILFKPKALTGAIGVYDSKESCIKQYQEDNEIIRENYRACAEIRDYYADIPEKDPLYTAPRVRHSTSYLCVFMEREGKGHRNSQLFKDVHESLKAARAMEQELLADPNKTNDKVFMNDMKQKYQTLSERTQAYLDKRAGAVTTLGQRRLDLMQSILGHSQRKIQSVTNAIKDPNPEKSILVYTEFTRQYYARTYATQDELEQEQLQKENESKLKAAGAIDDAKVNEDDEMVNER